MTLIANQIFENLTKIISTQMYVGQVSHLKANSFEAYYEKNNVSLLSPIRNIQDIQIKVPSYCDILNSNCSNRIVTQKVVFLNC